jgi:uncharacterized protein (TIRG00374 family)
LRKINRRLLLFLEIAAAVALLYYIFQIVPFAGVSRSLRAARMGEVVAGLVLLFAARVTAAFRMKLLTDRQGLSFSLAELFEISTTASFYNLLLPGTISGGIVRWYKLARQGQPMRALASLTWDRLADATMVAAIGVAGWLLAPPAGPHAAVGPALLVVFGGLGILHLAGFSQRAGQLLLRPIEIVSARFRAEWARTKLREAVAAARRYHEAGGGFPYAVAALSLLSQLLGAAAFVLWARSLGISAGVAELTWARSCFMLVVLLPVTFAGLGAREGILILLLRPYGVSGAEAVALSFLQLGASLVMAGVGGVFELRSLWRRRSAESGGAAAPPEANR